MPAMSRLFDCLAYTLREAALTRMSKVERFLNARRNRRAVRRLADWDDRLLKDIGLSRSEVLGAVAAGYDEDPSTLLQRSSPSEAVLSIERSQPLRCLHSSR
jgi:uncharacterized protein YjiS (DUF1127 family)